MNKKKLISYNFKKFIKTCKAITIAQMNCAYANASEEDKSMRDTADKVELIYVGGREEDE